MLTVYDRISYKMRGPWAWIPSHPDSAVTAYHDIRWRSQRQRPAKPIMSTSTQSPSNYLRSLFDPELVPTAVRVALIVGSIVFVINHGWALLQGQMSRARWVSGGLTYLVPYMVNIHGQYVSRKRARK